MQVYSYTFPILDDTWSRQIKMWRNQEMYVIESQTVRSYELIQFHLIRPTWEYTLDGTRTIKSLKRIEPSESPALERARRVEK